MPLPRPPHALAAAALAAGTLAGAASALAAEPWSPPATVPGGSAGAPTIAFDRDGLGLLTADTGGAGAAGPHTVGALAHDDAFGRMSEITPANFALADHVATYGKSRVAGLGTRFRRTHDRVGLVFGRAGARLTGIRYLGPAGRDAIAESLAADEAGDVAATFGTCAGSGCARQQVYLVVRRAGHSPGRPMLLDGDARDDVSTAAVNARGDVLVAWRSRRGLMARLRTASGTLHRAQRIGAPREPVTAISAVLSPRRAATVVWSAQAVSEGDAGSAATVDGAIKPRGATRRFGAARRLALVPVTGTGHYVGERRVKVVRAPDGRIAAAWTGYSGGRFVVQVAGVSGTRFTAAKTVSEPGVDSVLADLDAGPRSELAVLWRTGVAGNDPGVGPAGLEAALRAPGASQFGAAEQIEQGTAALNATLRFDPATGRAVAAWNQLGATGVKTSVRAAQANGGRGAGG